MRNTHRSRRPVISTRKATKVCQAAVASAVILTGPIHAQTTHNWDATATTANWFDAANWSTDALPGINDIAAFNATSTQQTITLGATPITIQTLNFTANTSSSYLLQNGAFILNAINQLPANELAIRAQVAVYLAIVSPEGAVIR